ncbi:TonB-dependent receptor [Cytophagales bacterium LB-30]|uniref:TonB-dependent receptor n=1 Tax=Shiella aurantiaca TaxID=3058365 RepID=A0ABT8F0Y6_9BACT|nr:TonB-dependent receptor [Shiella aurantiaca]MDN4164063.1 TonB-dependent receptor [Shiella aurantiaca]
MIRTIKFAIFSLVCFAALPAQAQVKWDEDGEIKDSEIVIEKDRTIELPAFNRSFEKVPPLPEQKDKAIIPYQFPILTFSGMDLLVFEPKIRPLTMQEEKLDKYYGNYVKLGVGNYRTSYLDLFLNSKRSKNYAYGFHYQHLSSQSGPVRRDLSSNSLNDASVYGKVFSKNTVLEGDLNYNRQAANFYGAAAIDSTQTGVDQQLIHRTSVGITLSNNKSSSIDYRLGTRFEYLTTYYEAQETNFDAEADFTYAISDKVKAFVTTDWWISQYKDSTSLNRSLFRLNPGFTFAYLGFDFTAGLRAVYENDTAQNLGKMHIFPTLKAEYQVTDQSSLYLSIEGDAEKRHLSGVLNENIYLGRHQELSHTLNTLSFTAGYKGKVLQSVGYHAGISLGTFKNMGFYNLSGQDSARFDLVYDKGTSQRLHLFGELNFNKEEKLRSILRGDYYKYTTDVQAEAWHRPTYKLSLLNTYNLSDKILFNADFYLIGGIKALNPLDMATVELPTIVDLNLKIDYQFNKRSSAFISFNNLLGKEYQYYLNYPVRGIQVMVGGALAF